MSRKKGVTLSYILLFVETLSSIFFTPFLIRSLGQAEYGLYSLVGSITSYLLLLDLGVGNAVVRYLAKFRVLNDKKKQQNVLALSLVFYLLIGLIVVIIGSILKDILPSIFKIGLNEAEIKILQVMFKVTMLNVAATFAFLIFDKALIAFERFTFSKSIAIMRILLRITICTIVLKAGGRGIDIVIVNFILTILIGVISVLYVIFALNIKPHISGIDKGFVKEMFSYSIFIFIQMIATHINSVTDQILLGIMTSSVTVGIYAVGAQVVQYVQSIAGSINGVLMPGVVRIVELKAEPDRILDEMVRIGRILFMILGIIWINFLLFGRDFITLWAGLENADAYLVTTIITFPMVFYLTQAIGTQVLWAKGEHKTQAYLKIMVAVTNIALTLLLIKWNPIVGASLGTAIAILFGDVFVMNIVFKKHINISMKKYYKGLFKGILPCLGLSLIVGLVMKFSGLVGWGGFILKCFITTFAFILPMWIYGMNNYEKNLVLGIFRKFIK